MRRIARLYSPVISLLAAFALLGASSCQKGIVKPDALASAISANDYTAIVEGCGNQPIPGYTYCRVHEGEATSGVVTFMAPATVCLDKDPVTGSPWTSCASVTLYDPNGNNPIEWKIPRGQTSMLKTWKEITGQDTFQKGDRGYWVFTVNWHWIDPTGRDQQTQVEGEIRMRVIATQVCPAGSACLSYLPLNDAPDDPNFAWTWTQDNVILKVTTGGRTYVGPIPAASPSPAYAIGGAF